MLMGQQYIRGTKIVRSWFCIVYEAAKLTNIYKLSSVSNISFSAGQLCPVYPSINSFHYDYETFHSSDIQVNSASNSKDFVSNSLVNLNSKAVHPLRSLRSQLNLDTQSSIQVIQANCTVFKKENDCHASQFEALLNLADRSLCRCEPGTLISHIDKCLQEVEIEKRRREVVSKWKKIQATRELPTIFAITPTYQRSSQKVDLTSLCQTVMHIPNFVWIIIEDAVDKTTLVTNLLHRCKAKSVHLNVRTPVKMRPRPGQEKNPSAYSRGVEQRNAGLNWIRSHCSEVNCRGVVYFMDDDNKYDLRLFEEVRSVVNMYITNISKSPEEIMCNASPLLSQTLHRV